jgi:hypothetical protein
VPSYCCAKLCNENAVRAWAADEGRRLHYPLGVLARALNGELQSRDNQMAELASSASLDLHSAQRAITTLCLEAKLRKEAGVSSASNILSTAPDTITAGAAAAETLGAHDAPRPKRRVATVFKALCRCIPKAHTAAGLPASEATHQTPSMHVPVRALPKVACMNVFVDKTSCTEEEIRLWAIDEGHTAPVGLQPIVRWMTIQANSDSLRDVEVARALLGSLGFELPTVFASAHAEAAKRFASKRECSDDEIHKWLEVNANSWPDPASSFWRDSAFDTFVAHVRSSLPTISALKPQQPLRLSPGVPNSSLENAMLSSTLPKYSCPTLPSGPFVFPLALFGTEFCNNALARPKQNTGDQGPAHSQLTGTSRGEDLLSDRLVRRPQIQRSHHRASGTRPGVGRAVDGFDLAVAEQEGLPAVVVPEQVVTWPTLDPEPKSRGMSISTP